MIFKYFVLEVKAVLNNSPYCDVPATAVYLDSLFNDFHVLNFIFLCSSPFMNVSHVHLFVNNEN